MTGKLDEISTAIGELRSDVRSMSRSMDRDRETADERHRENTDNLEQVSVRVESLEDTVKPLAKTVSAMEPIVQGILIKGWMRAGAIGVLGTIAGIAGWLAWQIIQHAGAWFWSMINLKP